MREEGDEVSEHARGEGDDQRAPLAIHVTYPPVHRAPKQLQDGEHSLEVAEHHGVGPQGLGEVGKGAGLDPVARGVEEDVDMGDQSYPARVTTQAFFSCISLSLNSFSFATRKCSILSNFSFNFS